MKQKRILFYLYAYYPYGNANSNVCQPFIDKLKTVYQVDVLTQRYDKNDAQSEIYDGVRIFRYKPQGNSLWRLGQFSRSIDMQKQRALWKRIILRPLFNISALFDRYTDGYRKLKKLEKQNDYDLIIATCSSIVSMKDVLWLKSKSAHFPKWISYFMDPNAYYIGYKKYFDSFIRDEIRIYENSDLILTTDEIYRENMTNVLSKYLYKTRPVPFGNLVIARRDSVKIKDSVINCVFAGSLFDLTVRNPGYFYKVFSGLGDGFRMYLICKSMSPENRSLFERYLGGRSNVELMINLSLQESLDYINNADILINFGNRTVNQTPSKIFDYISTGLPIVNFYSLESDTSKYYLTDYENKINIFEDDSLLDGNIDAFTEFCLTHGGQRTDADTIRKSYAKYTAQSATEVFLREVESLINQPAGENM